MGGEHTSYQNQFEKEVVVLINKPGHIQLFLLTNPLNPNI